MKRLNFSLLQIKIIYIITTVFLVLLSIYAFLQVQGLIDSSNSVNHTNKVTLSLQEIAASITEAETSQRGFLLTHDSLLLEKRDAAFDRLKSELNYVNALVYDNKLQVSNLEMLRKVIDDKLASMEEVLGSFAPLQTSPIFRSNILDGVHKMNAVRNRLREMANEETRLLAVRAKKYSQLSFITPLFVVVLFLGAILILLLSYFRLNNAFRYSQDLLEKLEEEKSLAETIINSSVDNIYVLNKDLGVITLNKKEEEINGVKRQEHIGENLLEIFPQIKDTIPHKNLLRALQGETVIENQYLSTVTGRSYRAIYSPLKTQDEIRGVISIAHDITDLLDTTEQLRAANQLLVNQNESLSESERFNRTLTDVSPNVVYIYDLDKRRTIFLNRTGLDIIGYSHQEVLEQAEELQNMLVHPDDLPKVAEMLANIGLLKDGEVVEKEFRVSNRLGQWIPFLARHSSFKRNADGLVTQIIGIAVDITERKKATDALEQKNIALEKMNEELQSFAYVSSHDLQEPLRKMQLFSSLLLEKEQERLSTDGAYYLTRIEEAGRRMQQLIEDLLAYSRTNDAERNFEYTNIGNIVEEVREELRFVIEQNNAVIDVKELCSASIIPFQFRQLVLNLLSNSLKFSHPDRKPHIVIESCIEAGESLKHLKLDPAKNYCHLSVADNGIGFAPEFSERIFELFQRLHSREKYKGTGIGLAIVKKIVNNHNGVIVASGNDGTGARFDIYIPGLT